MCAKYYELRYMFYKKNCISSKLARLLDTVSKFALFSASSLKDEQLIKKQTYMKTKTCKLYSRVFWIFLPNFIKIDAYYFELCRLKVCAFFLRHSVFLTLLVGACHIDIATSMSWRHVNLSKEHSLAIARPKLSGRRSSSTVLNQVFLGLPVLHRQLWENPECRPGELENGLEWYLKTEDLLVQL